MVFFSNCQCKIVNVKLKELSFVAGDVQRAD